MPAQASGLGAIPPAGFENQDQAQNWYDAQWQLQKAQAGLQAAFTPPSVENYGPVASRISPAAIPLKMIEALLAKRAWQKYAAAQGPYYQHMLEALGGGAPGAQPPTMAAAGAPQGPAGPQPSPLAASYPAPPPPQASPAAPGASMVPPAGPGGMPPGMPGMPPGGPGPMPGGAQGMLPPSSNAVQEHAPTALNPLGLNPMLASMILIRDPMKYAELQMGTPEWRNALAATGGNIEAARTLLLQKAMKDGTIELRPGGEALVPELMGGVPTGGTTSYKNPNLPQGMSFIRGPHGEPIPYQLPGVLSFEQAQQYATRLGQEQAELHDVERGGRKITQFGLQGIPGAPAQPTGLPPGSLGPGMPGATGPMPGGAMPPSPAPAAPGGAAAPQQTYFPAPPAGGIGGGAAALGGGAAAHADRSWWPDMPLSKAAQMPAYGGLDPKQDMDLKLEREHAAKLGTQYGLEADTSNQKLEYSSELLRALPRAFTGPQAQGTAQFWNAVAQVPWVAKFLPKNLTQDAAGTQIAVKNLVNQAIQGARALYGSKMAAVEVMLQKNEASPSITQGIQAIYALQRQEDAKSAYFIQRANDWGKFDNANGNPWRFEAAYARRFPLANFAHDYAERNAGVYQLPRRVAPPAMVQDLMQDPEHRSSDFLAHYGYLPPEMRH